MTTQSSYYTSAIHATNGQNEKTQVHGDDVVIIVLYTFVVVLGIPGNLTILLTYARKKKLFSTDILIITLALVDLVASVLASFQVLRSSYPPLVTTGLCIATHTAENSIAISSLALMMVISIDRYLAVCRPFRRRLSRRQGIVIGVACVALSLGATSPPGMFSWPGSVRSDSACLRDMNYDRALVLVGILVTVFVVSLLVTTIMYIKVFIFLKSRAKIHADLVGIDHSRGPLNDNQPSAYNRPTSRIGSSLSPDVRPGNDVGRAQTPSISKMLHDRLKTKPVGKSDSDGGSRTTTVAPTLPGLGEEPVAGPSNQLDVPLAWGEPQRRLRMESKSIGRKTTLMLLVVTVYFFISWSPRIIVSVVWRHLNRMSATDNSFTMFITILVSLRSTNHVINFFMYYLVNTNFRNAVKKCLKFKGFGKNIW
ncbi:uncharacterized protein [Diadema antillarum]|uniref:uncharacterized protein n=1 Tax=Diadema antillarum TaxID=105358 RepID=UPI003A84521C